MKPTTKGASPSQDQTTTARTIRGIPDIANIVQERWERAADNLSDTELDWFARSAGDYASLALRNLETVMEGIGCLVSSDDQQKMACGNFQDGRKVPALLFRWRNRRGTPAPCWKSVRRQNHRRRAGLWLVEDKLFHAGMF